MVDSTRKVKLSTMRNFAVMLIEQLYDVHEFLILQKSYSWKQCYTPFLVYHRSVTNRRLPY